MRALQSEGYTKPTPIQEQSIPVLLERRDLLGCAQTGTGKTAAFAIPILQLLHQDELYKKGPQGIKTLILTPTRELAIQIGESFAAYGKHLRIKHTVIFGGVGQKPQTDALRAGVDVLIATPGRLLDLMVQRFVHLQHVKIFVLDEADRMLDMGFIHDVKKIIAKIPPKRQTLFFSATMPPEISKLSSSILINPVKVEVTPISTTADTIQQSIYMVEKKDKKKLLHHLLQDRKIATALVFTRTKHGADKVVKDLVQSGIKAEAIHGNKSQSARQRALANFKARATRVLVATDIAARGIDIDELSHVINYELPNVPETYVHRIGRTGRAGAAGISISFCDDEEKEFLYDIQKLIGKSLPVVEDQPYHMTHVGMARPKHEQRQSTQRHNGNNSRRHTSHRGGSSNSRNRGNGSSNSTSRRSDSGNSSSRGSSSGNSGNRRSSNSDWRGGRRGKAQGGGENNY